LIIENKIKLLNINFCLKINFFFNVYVKWGLGIGDWGLGIWDWAQYPKTKTPNPKTQTQIK
jgi:hypothetical protein